MHAVLGCVAENVQIGSGSSVDLFSGYGYSDNLLRFFGKNIQGSPLDSVKDVGY